MFFQTPSIHFCPSHSLILPLSIYHELETPVRWIHPFVSLSWNNAGCRPQIATAHITFVIFNLQLRAPPDSVCSTMVSILISLSLENNRFRDVTCPKSGRLGFVKNPTLFEEAPASLSAIVPSVTPLSSVSAVHAETRWLPSNSICSQRRGYLHEHVSHHLADIPTWQSHREDWSEAHIKVLFPFWSNSSFPQFFFPPHVQFALKD